MKHIFVKFILAIFNIHKNIWRYDIQHNNIQHNDIQHNDIQQKGLNLWHSSQTTLSKVILRMMGLFTTHSINDTQHNATQHKGIECHYAQWRYAECHVFIGMLSVIMLTVILPSVLAPSSWYTNFGLQKLDIWIKLNEI